MANKIATEKQIYYVKPSMEKEEIVTKQVQELIDKCAIDGGEIRFSSGEYVLTTVYLKSGVSIVIEEDATILGSLDFNDYDFHEKIDYPLYQDASHSYFNCSMFVGIDCDNISITGAGKIDMRSVWDEENKRDMVHRGAKTISLKNCHNVNISDIGIYNTTDLAIYFAGCENVLIERVKMRVHIDGISPDCSKNVVIRGCEVESGDDGIVLKSSYTLNKLDICKNILIENCRVKSFCNAIKFGTESNGGFEDITIRDIEIYDTRITALALETVDGAKINNIKISDIKMKNVCGAPIFIHIGMRMRAPEGLQIGTVSNVSIENVTVDGPYEPFDIITANYNSFKAKEGRCYPWFYKVNDEESKEPFRRLWHVTSNICGLEGNPIRNVSIKNLKMRLYGGVNEFNADVPKIPKGYLEVYVYGEVLPASGIYFRNVKGLVMGNVNVETYKPDVREPFVYESVEELQTI